MYLEWLLSWNCDLLTTTYKKKNCNMNIHLLSKTQKTCPPPSEAKTQIWAELKTTTWFPRSIFRTRFRTGQNILSLCPKHTAGRNPLIQIVLAEDLEQNLSSVSSGLRRHNLLSGNTSQYWPTQAEHLCISLLWIWWINICHVQENQNCGVNCWV